jgi:hypothetical protein
LQYEKKRRNRRQSGVLYRGDDNELPLVRDGACIPQVSPVMMQSVSAPAAGFRPIGTIEIKTAAKKRAVPQEDGTGRVRATTTDNFQKGRDMYRFPTGTKSSGRRKSQIFREVPR